MTGVKINLYLMGYRGYKCLEYVVNSEYRALIKHVIIANDPSIEEDYVENILEICESSSLAFSFKNSFNVQDHDENNTISIAISWRWLLNTKNLIIFHDSLLPKYRGFSPLVSQIINGEETLGVTALLCGTNGYDSGDILSQSKISIQYPITIEESIKQTTTCYIKILTDILPKIKNEGPNYLKGTPQNEHLATYSLWRDQADYLIDWSKDAEYIERFVNATGYPYLGAQTQVDGELVFIKYGKACADLTIENRSPGKFIFVDSLHKPTVVCGKGLYKIEECITRTGENFLENNSKFRLRFG